MSQVGKIKSLYQVGNKIHLGFEKEKGELVFWKEDLIRFRLDLTGAFTDDTQGKSLLKMKKGSKRSMGYLKW